MRTASKISMLVTTVILGMTVLPALAAPPAAGNPTGIGKTSKSGQARHAEMTIEQRITDLRGKLMISQQQEASWDAFAQVMRENARSMDQTFQQRVHTMPAMTAVENMQSYAQIASTHADAMQKLVPALQALYDTMSDSQKKTADQVFRSDAHNGEAVRHG